MGVQAGVFRCIKNGPNNGTDVFPFSHCEKCELSMFCSNCGKEIPYHGKVCPWCHADKQADKERYSNGTIAGIGTGVAILAIAIILGAVTGTRHESNLAPAAFFGFVAALVVGWLVARIVAALR